MIPKETVDKIFESIKIEEVIADYLPDLKKKELITGHAVRFITKKLLLFQFRQLKAFINALGAELGAMR